MGRIVAIDYGKKRAGVAVSDPLGKFAVALGSVEANNLLAFLEAYTKKEKVDSFLVGYPKTLQNGPSQSLKFINPFIGRLIKKFPGIPVEVFDERFTSSMALQAMIDGGMPKMKRQEKGRVDTISAVIILQGFLDSIHNKVHV